MRRGLFTLTVFFMTVIALRAFGAETYPVASVQKLEIDVASVDVSIEATTGKDASLDVVKRKGGDDCVLESKLDGSSWRIRVKHEEQNGFFRKGCDWQLTLKVGPATSIRLDSASGDVRIQDVSGDLALNTASGDINIRSLAKDIRIKSGSGEIGIALGSAIDKPGDKTPNLRVDTGSGDITVEVQRDLRGAEMRVATGSGDVSIALPKDAKVRSRHSTGSGDMHSAFGTSDNATFNVEARSGSGDLDIRAL